MTHFMFLTIALAFSLRPTRGWAQDCRPDVTRQDKISKAQVEVWAQELYATSFGSSLMNTSEVGITATIGRYGTLNAVNLQITKREESATNAAFESAYRAAVGKPFYFGFKNGDPIAFTVTEVTNEAKVQQGVFAAKGVTTVVLSAVVGDDDLATMRDVLTSRQIDAVRILLAGDLQVEKSVSDKNGKRMLEKLSCFYQALDKRGVVLSAAAAAASREALAKVTGRYALRGKAENHIDLRPDGSYSIHQSGKDYIGTFVVQGDSLVLTERNGHRVTAGHFVGGALLDPESDPWDRITDPKQDAGAKPAAQETKSALTIEQILKMVEAKLPDDVIISTIRKSTTKPNLTPEELIKLKTAGVSDAVIRALVP